MLSVLREVGACFSVNKMLTAECYKQRMEQGLTFLEFNYMIMQSYDFYKLFQDYGCNMQFGGDDQWSNMLGGTELIRTKAGQGRLRYDHYPASELRGQEDGQNRKGRRMAGSRKDNARTSFTSTGGMFPTQDVIKCLKLLTFVPIEQIEEMERTLEGQQLNQAKELLAYELTELVHGKEEADKAQDCCKGSLYRRRFKRKYADNRNSKQQNLHDGGMGILTLMVQLLDCVPPTAKARRLVQQGGVSVNNEKVTDPKAIITLDGETIIKKGKKVFHKVVVE